MHLEPDSSSESFIPGLPDDLASRCLARVPRSHHGALRCVCRRWNQFVSSEEFLSLRKSLGLTQGWLYTLTRDKSECLHWHVLDPSTRTWMSLPHILEGKYGLACEVVGKDLFVMGGCGKYEDSTSQVLKYDALKNKWTHAPNMQAARCHFVSASLGGRIYAIGGMGPTSGSLTSWEIFDVENNSWSLYEDPNIVTDLGESLVLDNRIYVRHASPSVIPPSYAAVYDPEGNTWTTLDNQMTQLWCGPAVTLGNGDACMLDQTLGIKLMVLNRDAGEWCTLGRLSPHSIRTPCRIATIGKKLYVVGRGLRTIVLDLEKAGTSRGLLVASSIDGLQSATDDIVVSCNVIEL